MVQQFDPSISAAAEAQTLAAGQRNVRLEGFKGFVIGSLSALPMTAVSSVLIGGAAALLGTVAVPLILGSSAAIGAGAAFIAASGATLAVGTTIAGAGSANERRRQAQFHNFALHHAQAAIQNGTEPTQTLLTADERRQLDHPVAATLVDAGRRANPIRNWASFVTHRGQNGNETAHFR